ncbi:hypothetical protein K435DRAFT_717241 [Dendrothele bispora CBS 962.96]|uniref:RING-type domain-containing protein n=1 Tax=Dendrothele bispora (strain CBS 962.96) TaxID=1314807 RepID=A0A4S8MJN8_DENBC|nr:hypothetical protein K435DRAFT_717241 [Dendrothele bispora CBS 962.96]
MPSMANFNYVDGVNPNLLCCICRMPFNDPFTTQTCGHTFCRDCILQSLDHVYQCPIDRQALTADDLKPADSIIRSLVDELVVECTNQTCSHICQRQLLEQHLQSSCPYVEVPCPSRGCDQIMLRGEAVNHRCEYSLVTCDACDTEVEAAQLEDHRIQCYQQLTTCDLCGLQFQRSAKSSHQNSCPESPMQCPQQVNGCSWKGKRVALHSEHISSCPYQALSGFFSIFHERTQVLQDENTVLKRRVESLQTQIRTIEIQLQSASLALGPWFRNSNLGLSSPETSISDTLRSPDLPSHQRPRLQTVSSPRSVPEGDAFAAYFPPQEEIQSYERQQLSAMERPAPDRHLEHPVRSIHRNSWSLGQGWDALHTPASRTSKQVASAVAPLDFSCTLEGTLEGLRESIVALSTSMETLGRRNDIALTNETLRLNEELMSLKANIHGLRMQMHAMMMDNAQLTGRTDPLLFENSFPTVSTHRYHYMSNTQSATKL